MYVAWEISLFSAGLSLVLYLGVFNAKNHVRTWLFVLATKLILTSCLMFIFVLLKWIVLEAFFITSVLLLCVALLNKQKHKDLIRSSLEDVSRDKKSLFSILSMLAIFTIGSVSPMIETDSNFASNFLLLYANNIGDVFNYAWNYSPLWELNYLPGVFLFNNWISIYFINFQVIILIFLAVFELSKTLRGNNIDSRAIALALITTPILWLNAPSGIATIKNDQIYAAGSLLIIVSIIESYKSRTLSSYCKYYFYLGSILVLVKFSGPILIGISVLGFVCFRFLYHQKSLKEEIFSIRNIILLLPCVIYTSPYIHNTIVFGSPVYPVKIKLFGEEFPGYFNTQGTRIFEYLNLPETWIALSGVNVFPFSTAGLLFVPFLLWSPIFLFQSFKGRKVRTDASEGILIISMWILLLLYIVTPFSSGTLESPLLYLTSQNTLRYVIVVILICSLLAINNLFLWLKWMPIRKFILVVVIMSNFLTIQHTNNVDEPKLIEMSLVLILGINSYGLFKSSEHRFPRINSSSEIRLLIYCSSILLLVALASRTENLSRSEFQPNSSIGNLVGGFSDDQYRSLKTSGYCALREQIRSLQYFGPIDYSGLEALRNEQFPHYLVACLYPWFEFSKEDAEVIKERLIVFGYRIAYVKGNRMVLVLDPYRD